MRNRAFLSLWLALLCAAAGAQAHDLPEVLARGRLSVAFYNGLPPFSDKGSGIDVDLAQALAAKLGVRLSPVWFDADENLDDDLRNMVWKGHYLGLGPADAMMHVPIDQAYMQGNGRVKFLAPYYRERFEIARDTRRIPALDSLEVFAGQKIGVELDTWPDIMLLAAEGGRYRENVVHFPSAAQAIEALKAGRVAAVYGRASELQAGLTGVADVAIAPAPLARGGARQWAVGMAVKAEHEALARRLQQAMNELQAEGTIERIFARHGVQPVAP